MALTSIFESSSGEQQWIAEISKILEKEVKVAIDLPVSIFRVPATLSVSKPKAYTPQVIGLGPYHHFRPELYDMERYKLAAASKLQQEFRSLEFKQLVSGLSRLEYKVRACYHKYLDFEGETIAWIMAIDGLFLLEFLRCYNSSPSITTAHLVDSTGRKLAHEAVLGDVLMLENQIPIFVLSKILSMQYPSHLEVADDLFPSILMDFCKALSPLKTREDLILSEVPEHAHLLDLLYHLIIVPRLDGPAEPCNIQYGESEDEALRKTRAWIQNIVGVSGKFISSVSKSKEDIEPGNEVSHEETKTPKVEEIMIPSASHLSYAGVQFCPTTGGIATIKFDQRTKKFYLPVISLNVNSEVIMRNLVAYEASIGSESLAFTRYIELMNGIVDTAEDAKLLREKKIIVNSLKSDADVAQLFNGMSKCVRLTNVPFIDKAIEDVNNLKPNMPLTSIFESSSGEQRWLAQISEILEKEVKVEIDHPVTIFRVPATLSVSRPSAYTPQVIGLGPYHRFRLEIYDMERLEYKVRACYHKYLDVEGETLTWIMAIDGLFLLEFLRCYNSSASITTAHLVDSIRRKLAHEAVLGDILMLENQIPIFVLREILSMQCSSQLEGAEGLFPTTLKDFCKALSPVKTREDLILSRVSEHAHLLDLLYHLIVPELLGPAVGPCNIYWESEAAILAQNPDLDSSKFSTNVFENLWGMCSKLNVEFVSKITTLVQNIGGVSGKFMSSIPSKSKEDIKPENEETKTPNVEEIMIPSVSSLSHAGVPLRPATGGIMTVKFDQRTKKLYLPVIRLNVNSEVIMRNLVAYEASIGSESLAFTRYIELMNGLINTAEDAKLLREKKIIVNSLKSDADVAQLFNGVSKPVRLTNVPFIDKTIEDVNKYYNNTKAVKFNRRFKNFVYESWRILTILAVVLLMLLMGVQSFCSVYSCPKLFGTLSSE
ncbi:hypothetical protein RHGRI_009156 [Rhododendron griersonianum]|uniref:Uncharacterized protein n=1 Tax=Rhododendron griersonianum TaxID=479676 RepID=A0AAV6L4C0_9ERIC|nr:hypothetical protein RHGRI_009156 [Rhododendron griersonianum]